MYFKTEFNLNLVIYTCIEIIVKVAIYSLLIGPSISRFLPLALRIMGIALRLAHQCQDNVLVKK